MKQQFLEYLEDQKAINEAALKPYDTYTPIQDADEEVRKMKAIEVIRLTDRIHELSKHIAVVKRMVPVNGEGIKS